MMDINRNLVNLRKAREVTTRATRTPSATTPHKVESAGLDGGGSIPRYSGSRFEHTRGGKSVNSADYDHMDGNSLLPTRQSRKNHWGIDKSHMLNRLDYKRNTANKSVQPSEVD